MNLGSEGWRTVHVKYHIFNLWTSWMIALHDDDRARPQSGRQRYLSSIIMDSRPSPPASLFRRRRRLACLVVFVITLLVIFGVPWELPSELQDSAVVPTGLSRANIVPLAKQPSHQAGVVDEIYGLLHFVTRNDQFLLSTSEALDPGKPIDLKVYSNGKEDWSKNVKKLNEEYPIIVFSKVRPEPIFSEPR
jgi:hypothetical protein